MRQRQQHRALPSGIPSCVVALLVVWLVPTTSRAMSEGQLEQLYLDVVEQGAAVFEPLWVDDSERVPGSGFFDFRRYKNWQPEWYAAEITVPGNGMIVFCYSVLLTETDKEFFTDRRIPRSQLLEHATKAIRWCCLTSAYVDHPHPFHIQGMARARLKGNNWVRRFGHRTDVMGWLTIGTAKLWGLLDDETKALVEAVMIGGAPKERFFRGWKYGDGGLHDTIKQDFASTIGAAYLFPDREDAKLYQEVIRGNGIGLVATVHDRAREVVADGEPIRQWAKGWNLYQDYSSDHHGWAHPCWYGGGMLFEARTYVQLLSALTGSAVPETFTHQGNGFDGVLEWLKVTSLPEGEPAPAHGMEYDAYYGAALLAYCYGAVVKKDPVAAALEERAARLLQRHTRAVKMYDYHRNSWAMAAAALLMHKSCGPRAEPLSYDGASRALAGAYHYRWQQNLVHRSPSKWVSFSWGTTSSVGRSGPHGFVVPARSGVEQPEPLVYLHPQSLRGNVTVHGSGGPPQGPRPRCRYRHDHSDAGFHTAGAMNDPGLDRYYAFFTFDDGPSVMLSVLKAPRPCRLSWTGLPFYFYVREGLTGSRSLFDAQGTQRLEQTARRTSSWWCVDDIVGMAVGGGNDQIRVERSVGLNWPRTEAYRDKCDGVFVSPVKDVALEAGEVGVDMAVAIYTSTPRDRVAQASGELNDGALQLPSGWRGLVVPDAGHRGKRYLVLSNLYGEETATALDLSFDEGAPILSEETTIEGRKGSATLQLPRLASLGEAFELYVETEQGTTIRARRETRFRYGLSATGGGTAQVRLRYRGRGAESIVVSDVAGRELGRLPAASLRSKEGHALRVEASLSLEVLGKACEDHIGPAVEIESVAVRDDRRVSVEVRADDQSGVRSVELYCDGIRVGQKSRRPYAWECRPGRGWHTFHAVATDASTRGNRRTSFLRTVEVGNRARFEVEGWLVIGSLGLLTSAVIGTMLAVLLVKRLKARA